MTSNVLTIHISTIASNQHLVLVVGCLINIKILCSLKPFKPCYVLEIGFLAKKVNFILLCIFFFFAYIIGYNCFPFFFLCLALEKESVDLEELTKEIFDMRLEENTVGFTLEKPMSSGERKGGLVLGSV